MNSADLEKLKDELEEIPLDDEHGHIFIEYNKDLISLQTLIKTVEMTGARILKSFSLEQRKNHQAVLFRLNVQDVRGVVLSLSNLSFIKVKGYNPKPKINIRGENR